VRAAAAVLVVIGLGACAHARLEPASLPVAERALGGVLDAPAPRPALDASAFAEAGNIAELLRSPHGSEPLADLDAVYEDRGDLSRAVVRDGLAYGFALLGQNGRVRLEPACRATGRLSSVAYEALARSALAPLGYESMGEIPAPCAPFARRIARLASAIATLGNDWRSTGGVDRDADAVALVCPPLAAPLAQTPRLLGTLAALRRAEDQPPGTCRDALARFRATFDAHLASLAAAHPELSMDTVDGEIATILADLVPDAGELAPVAACLTAPATCSPADAARLVVTLVDDTGSLGELVAGWTVEPGGAFERELLRFALDDPRRAAAAAPHVAHVLDPRALVGQLADRARDVASCANTDPVTALFSDKPCVGSAALAAIRADLAATFALTDRDRIGPAVQADARALLGAYVERVSDGPAPDAEAEIAALAAACADPTAPCHALLAEAPARVAAAAPQLVEARAATLFGPALAAFVRAGVAHSICTGASCPAFAEDDGPRLVAELVRDPTLRRALCGDCAALPDIGPDGAALLSALARQLAPAFALLPFTELAGPTPRARLAVAVANLADLMRAQPVAAAPMIYWGVSVVPQHNAPGTPRAPFYPRISVGAGLIMADNGLRARPFEEFGLGYRVVASHDFRIDVHLVASALLFQLVDNGYAKHPLFLGFGPDRNAPLTSRWTSGS
jgi:hypothetical protein